MKLTHRKGAKNAKCSIDFIKEFLCVLCVFAVKTAFMDGHYLMDIAHIINPMVTDTHGLYTQGFCVFHDHIAIVQYDRIDRGDVFRPPGP